jgi:hypothetical protein
MLLFVLVLFFFLQFPGDYVDHFPAVVKTAIFANRVGQNPLVTMGTRNKPDFVQGQMASPSSLLSAR